MSIFIKEKKRLALFLSLFLVLLLLLSGCGGSKTNEKNEPSSTVSSTESPQNSASPGQVDSLKSIEGAWEGSIHTPKPLLIIMRFEEDKGTISIPIQGITDYPLSVKLADAELFMEMNVSGQKITFDGKVEQDQIAGTFKQNGQSFPFELAKKNGDQQEDNANIVETKISTGMMKGQLELPQGEGKFPLMVIIAGSGPTDKDGNSLVMPGKNNSLKMIAEQLAEAGVASIRYDKRGIGNNAALGGKEEDIVFSDFVDDAVAWIEFARQDDRFSQVGVIGHSEGSLIGMAAVQQADADLYVSVAGAGRTIDEVLLEQLSAQLPEKLVEETKSILEQLKQGKQVDKVSNELVSVFRPSVQPYMISWLKYDPQQLMKQMKVPALVINGTTDLQVPATDAELLHKANEASKLLIIDNMNHVLKEASSDQAENMATYTNPDLPLAKGFMDGIVQFMKGSEVIQ